MFHIALTRLPSELKRLGWPPIAPPWKLLGRAKLRRVLDQNFKNGLKIERRSTDDLEHIGGGKLGFCPYSLPRCGAIYSANVARRR